MKYNKTLLVIKEQQMQQTIIDTCKYNKTLLVIKEQQLHYLIFDLL